MMTLLRVHLKFPTGLLLFLSVVTLNAQDAGKSGMAFLKVGAGSRAGALGEAYAALADDPSAIYWNPAGLANAAGTQLTFTYLNWLQGINHNFLAITFGGFGGTVGLGLTLQTIPDIELRDKPTPEPIGTFDSRDLALALSYGKSLSSRLRLGLTAKYLYEKLTLNSTSGVAFDAGLQWAPVAPVVLGASVQHVGKVGSLIDEEITLPALLRLGGAYVLPLKGSSSTQFSLAGEFVNYFNGGTGVNAGAEYASTGRFALRAGYQFGRENRGLTAGVGATLGRFVVDYGYAPFSNQFDDSHRFTVSFRI